MNTQLLIRKKRDGGELSKDEIIYLITSYTKNKIPDYQFSAFLMAVFLKGMTKTETAYLTDAMLNSGIVINLNHIKGVKVDKHSTGGVGDKTSLIIAPIAAAAGVYVPMISGRGLGHTGGTLDKLESIPGFRTNLTLSEYKSVIKKCGLVLIGQTKDIAPADKLIYALRDVTATVESIPLITSSIMSKKLAEGIDGIVMDIKTGSGAFMKELKDAITLSMSLVETAKSFNKKFIGFITDMNQPLGQYIGNWLEVVESVQVLQGKYVYGLSEISLKLAGAMIYLGNKAKSLEEGIKIAQSYIDNGKAFEKFFEIVKIQGGDISYLKELSKYPKSKYTENIYSPKQGYLISVNTFDIGNAALELGAGRKTKEDVIEPKAGIIFYPSIGDRLKKGEVIAEIFTDNKKSIDKAKELIYDSVSFSDSKPVIPKLIKKVIK